MCLENHNMESRQAEKPTCVHTNTHTLSQIDAQAHTCVSYPGITVLWVLKKSLTLSKDVLIHAHSFLSTLPLRRLLSLPLFSHTYKTHTHTSACLHMRAHRHTHTFTHINRVSVGEGEQNPFCRHNFVWQEWQILFYDWMGFSTLLGTHSPIMQHATAITLPVRLAQRRCSAEEPWPLVFLYSFINHLFRCVRARVQVKNTDRNWERQDGVEKMK